MILPTFAGSANAKRQQLQPVNYSPIVRLNIKCHYNATATAAVQHRNNCKCRRSRDEKKKKKICECVFGSFFAFDGPIHVGVAGTYSRKRGIVFLLLFFFSL